MTDPKLPRRLPHIRERLADMRPLLLDGATGSELHRRGVDTALPLWSATALWTAPQILQQIHRDYITAGSEVLTANTFRTHERNLARCDRSQIGGGRPGEAAIQTRLAVEIARDAAAGAAYVAGSLAPLEDCYRPDLVPPDRELNREHQRMAECLAAAGVDLILVETHNTIREAVAATRAAHATGLPTLVSFVCGNDGRLLSGERLASAAAAVNSFQPSAVLVNCLPAAATATAIEELRGGQPRHVSADQSNGPPRLGAYANIGRPDPQQGWVNTAAEDPERYAEFARDWLAAGATVVGGCCGTTPAHVEELRRLIGRYRTQ